MGNGGQRLTVNPDHDLVIAITAGRYDREDQGELPDRVTSAILATIRPR